jgi:hypothetical protein
MLLLVDALERNNYMIAKKIGSICAIVHSIFFIYIICIIHFYPPKDGQIMWGWIIFIFIDFIPSFTAYLLLDPWYTDWIISQPNSYFKEFLIPQYWLYGPICAVWWYYLPRLLMPKRMGGIWGKNPHEIFLK